MKLYFLPVLILVAGCYATSAQNVSYVTVTLPPNGTNAYTIAQGQAVEFTPQIAQVGTTIQKDGLTIGLGSLPQGQIVQGPATINFTSPNPSSVFITLKLIPESYDPNKTIIIPPGTNQVQITLQVSTNLINWNTATNGVYGSPNTAQFFRIREDNLVSP